MSMNGGYRGQHNGNRHFTAPLLARRHPSLPPLKGASDMPETGAIKFYDKTRGFGFIHHSGGDVFVHSKVVQQYGIADWQLEPNTQVHFAFMKDTARGPAADAICLVRT